MNSRIIALLAAMLLLQGCAAVAVTAGGIAAGVGVNQTLGGIAYKTVVSPMKNTRLATLKTLNRMEVNITKDHRTKEGWEITATASERTIDVQLERLTPTTTRMRVTVDKGNIFLRDRATANEIIAQSVQRLEQDQHMARVHRKERS